MRHQVQWPANQEGSGSPTSNPVTQKPRLLQPASPSTRKPPTSSSESLMPAASRPGVARRIPGQPRSGLPGSPAVATKPKMLGKLSKAQTFDQSSQSNQRKGLKATRTKTKSASTPASSHFPNSAPNQIITAGSTSRANRFISRCPCRYLV